MTKKQSPLMKLKAGGVFDEVYTPAYAIEPLIEFIPKDKIVWECTDFGASQITSRLRELGYTVVASHRDDFDFLEDTPDFEYDIIITNPPYSLKDKFLKRAYELNKQFAFLLPITSLEGLARGKLFRENNIEVLVLDGRVNFTKGKAGAWFNTSWFCNGLLPKQLVFKELGKDD